MGESHRFMVIITPFVKGRAMEVRVDPSSCLVQQTVDKDTVYFPLGFLFIHRKGFGKKRFHEFDLLLEVLREEPLRYSAQRWLPESGDYFWIPC